MFVMVWWVVDARKWFKGPKVNVDHLMLGREGNLVEGTPKDKVETEDGAELVAVESIDKSKAIKGS